MELTFLSIIATTFSIFEIDFEQNVFPHFPAGVAEEEQEFYSAMAGKCGRTFCSKSITNIEKVVAMIDRNVSSKILFCDLVNRMFLSV